MALPDRSHQRGLGVAPGARVASRHQRDRALAKRRRGELFRGALHESGVVVVLHATCNRHPRSTRHDELYGCECCAPGAALPPHGRGAVEVPTQSEARNWKGAVGFTSTTHRRRIAGGASAAFDGGDAKTHWALAGGHDNLVCAARCVAKPACRCSARMTCRFSTATANAWSSIGSGNSAGTGTMSCPPSGPVCPQGQT